MAAVRAAAGVLTGADSSTAMAKSLRADAAPRVAARAHDPQQRRGDRDGRGARGGVPGAPGRRSPRNSTRHVEISLPSGVTYKAGDHLGVCPKNDEEHVARLAHHLGAELDSLFMVPKTMNVRAVPKGVVLQVRNLLTNLVDITGRPTVPAARAADREGRRRR